MQQDDGKIRVAQPRGVCGNCLEDRSRVGERGADYAQNFCGCRLLLQGFTQLFGSLLDLALQPGVGVFQALRHLVELARQRFQLVAGFDLDAMLELTGADARCAFLNLQNRLHQSPRERSARDNGDKQGHQEQTNGSPQRGIERRERFRQRLLDEH